MVNVECRRAGIGCVEDKKLMADNLVQMLAPIQQRRRPYEEKPQQVWEILEEGSQDATARLSTMTFACVKRCEELASMDDRRPRSRT
jgi:tryptophanyl-tRNA synthetase